MTITAPKRNVHAQLNYWKPVEGNVMSTDFSKPEAEAEFEDHQKTGSIAYDITIKDVRGTEQDFSLSVNGFRYVLDPVAQLCECKTEDDITNVLLPATKELVKKQYVC